MSLKSTFHPGLTDEQLVNEVARGSKFQQARILDVVRTDLAKQIRDVLDSQAKPGGSMDVNKVDESEIVPAARKSIPIDRGQLTALPGIFFEKEKSAIPEAIKPVVKTKPVAKPVAEPVYKPAATPVRTIQVETPVAKPAATIVSKPVAKPVVTPVAKSEILTEETDVAEPKYTLHPGLEDSEVLKIIEEGGARAERVIRVVTTGRADAPVKTLSDTALLLIGAVILIFFVLK